jgi:hypothetical protein
MTNLIDHIIIIVKENTPTSRIDAERGRQLCGPELSAL